MKKIEIIDLVHLECMLKFINVIYKFSEFLFLFSNYKQYIKGNVGYLLDPKSRSSTFSFSIAEFVKSILFGLTGGLL